MRCLVQRVIEAQVDVDGNTVGRIGNGLLIFICAMRGDNKSTVLRAAAKLSRLRIFADGAGKMNLSLLDVAGSALVVSQFTLAADCGRGHRPGFSHAADTEIAKALCESLVDRLLDLGIPTQTGRFGAEMSVSLVNHGPATFMLDF